ncbi:MAG: type II secretion system F family protein, partial [Deltaproteobacteria bacterium]|nr:type II secretion system F family protein [Deltaproteobacteria bacterium]
LTFTSTVGGIAGLYILLSRARARRLALCDEQMPQALEIVALALRAGHALPGALRLAAEECPAPLSTELHRVTRENSLGRPMTECIADLARRLTGCASVETFAVAVLVLQETGGNLITVLERIVDSARARSSYRARLRALTAEGRQSAKLLAALPLIFAGLTISVDPTYIDTLKTSGGTTIAMIAVGMWLAGVLWVRRIVRPLA